MGSATREAVAAARAALASQAGAASLATGEDLLAAGRVIGGSAALRSALADPSIPAGDKVSIVGRVFASVSAPARALLETALVQRWSSQDDLLAGVEELGIRAVAASASDDIDIVAELFTFSQAVSSNSELELAVGSKLGDAGAKVELVQSLLGDKASAHTTTIVRHLVQQPRGRRIGGLLRDAADIVADEGGFRIATVTVASPLSDSQLERLGAGLAGRYGKLRINQIVDPAILGGLRVQVDNDVIDDSVATKLNELRLQLAG